MRHRTLVAGGHLAALPIRQLRRHLGGHPLPPGFPRSRHGHVGEYRVSFHRAHHVRIRQRVGSRRNAKKSRLGIDRMQIAVRPRLHPRDVVTHGPYSIAGVLESRNHHGQVGLAACARKRRRHVGHFARGVLEPQDQHVLRHPTLFARHPARNAQREAFLPQQRVAAVSRANAPDQLFFWKMQYEAPRWIQIAQRMQPGHKVIRLADPIERDLPDSRHDVHARHDVGAVRHLHARACHVRMRIRWTHQVGHHIHRAPGHCSIE